MLRGLFRRVRRVVGGGDGVCIGEGIRIEELYWYYPRVEKLYLSDSLRTRHMIVLGTTGSGKTRLVEHMVSHDIRSGKNVVVLDPKGDEDLLKRVIAVARECGRLNEVLFMSPVYPHLSVRINPLAHYLRPEELVQHVIACLPVSAKEPFFTEVAKEISQTVAFAMYYLCRRLGKRFEPTIADLNRLTTYSAIQNLIKELEQFSGDEEADGWRGRLMALTGVKPEHFAKISASLRTTLAQLSLGSIGEVISTVRHNEVLERFEAGERCILVVWMGSLMFRDPALSLARLIVSMIQALVGRMYAEQKRFNPPLMLFIDEASNVLYSGIEDMFNKARGAGVAIHAFTQSIADINARLGEDKARVILDNCNTKLFFKVNDPATSSYVANLIGARTDELPTYSAEGDFRVLYRSSQPLVEEADAVRLKARQFFLFRESECFKGVTVDVWPAKLRIAFSGAGTGGSPVLVHGA